MSRKAMKKTLKRLATEAEETIEEYNKALKDGQADAHTESLVANQALLATYRYVRALEDAYEELAEPLDKRLKIMEKAVQTTDETVKKKEKKKGTTYID